jgi:hypothetical protein
VYAEALFDVCPFIHNYSTTQEVCVLAEGGERMQMCRTSAGTGNVPPVNSSAELTRCVYVCLRTVST